MLQNVSLLHTVGELKKLALSTLLSPSYGVHSADLAPSTPSIRSFSTNSSDAVDPLRQSTSTRVRVVLGTGKSKRHSLQHIAANDPSNTTPSASGTAEAPDYTLFSFTHGFWLSNNATLKEVCVQPWDVLLVC